MSNYIDTSRRRPVNPSLFDRIAEQVINVDLEKLNEIIEAGSKDKDFKNKNLGQQIQIVLALLGVSTNK